MEALPCAVAPLTGETPIGYVGRLAAANNITVTMLTAHVSHQLRKRPASATPSEFVAGVERLGGLTPGYFDRERRSLRLLRRCHHHHWAPARCARCDVVDFPRPACLVCSQGEPTQIVSRGGAFCVRHDRWHFGRQGVLTRPSDAHRRAEQLLSSRLWNRGITMHTGEIELAYTLLASSFSEDHSDGGILPPAHTLYPACVHLTHTLTDSMVASSLVTHREDEKRQIEGLIGLTIGAGGGARTYDLKAHARTIIRTHRHALHEAHWMPTSTGATVKVAAFGKAIVEAAHRHRAVLLRHVSEVRVHSLRDGRLIRPAPRARVVAQRLKPHGWAV